MPDHPIIAKPRTLYDRFLVLKRENEQLRAAVKYADDAQALLVAEVEKLRARDVVTQEMWEKTLDEVERLQRSFADSDVEVHRLEAEIERLTKLAAGWRWDAAKKELVNSERDPYADPFHGDRNDEELGGEG